MFMNVNNISLSNITVRLSESLNGFKQLFASILLYDKVNG